MNPVPDDPGSLSRLHDIIVPPSTPWWPPAPAWYVLGAVLLIGGALLVAAAAIRWRKNWYRRAGLAELRRIEQARPLEPAALTELAELLKRVALAAYPRDRVAALTGAEWLQFLDRSGGTTDFTSGPGRLLLDVYGRRPAPPSPELFRVIRSWIRQHRKAITC